jgi:hypothetical protein
MPPARPAAGQGAPFSPEAQEVRALLRRVPDGFQAALNHLGTRAGVERERVMANLARGMGKEILPLIRAAALSAQEDLAESAIRVLPVFGTRAAADVLVEAYAMKPEGARARLAWEAAEALLARGIRVPIPEPEQADAPPRLMLRETLVSAPDGAGSRSVAGRLQDEFGIWYAVLVLWNDQAGVKDGFLRPFSRQEWAERMERLEQRRSLPVPCPPDFARWQVEEARQINARTGFPLEKHLDDWDRLVGSPSAGYAPPDPTRSVRAADEEERLQWLKAGGEIFETKEAESWFVEPADCVPWARKWGDLESRLRLRGASESRERERSELLVEASAALLDEVQLRLYRGRLLDLGRVCEWRHNVRMARIAAAAAVDLDEQGVSRPCPFLTALLHRSLSVTQEMLRRGEDLERARYRPMRRHQS